MRTSSFLIAGVATAMILLSACTKTDTFILSVSDAENIIPGSYKVATFIDIAGEGTVYENYIFQFTSNGDLTATDGTDTYTGTWSIENENDPVYDKKVTISIGGNTEMDVLNHGWLVEEVTDATLYLTDDTGVESVHFVKN
ncbi:MAG TPA: hypothetical protein PK511_09140 [Chitinophagales bacterium]|nr:hypothetical protein [Chitinophagales bacterium]HMX03661.1 hypothetical protein [Chitinophagales bacterium]HMZ89060.1 hypothetical protein [Chitinophagales bacterium]HNA56856.1 hypothetical protein [Chitinophagales bacterium]HNE46849.1 hypothetical protein [Chitinophagales bacterium]